MVSSINLLENQCKHFPSLPNNVSTLPCETLNAHYARATTKLLKKLQNLSYLNCGTPNSTDLNPVNYSMGNTVKEGVQNTHITYLDE